MANYNDYKNMTLYMIKSFANDGHLLANAFLSNEFTRNEFNAVRTPQRNNGQYALPQTFALETLIKYGIVYKVRTETYHVYAKRDCWGGTDVLTDMTDELWDILPQSIRDALDVNCEERKRCYYKINYDKVEEFSTIWNTLKLIFD